MTSYDQILITLASLIFILLLIRWQITAKDNSKKFTGNYDMFGCMTIGSRQVQEDCFFLNDSKNGTLLALADGMGEPFGGKIASRTAIDVVSDMFDSYNPLDNPNYFFRKSYNTVNREILKELQNGINGKTSLTTAIIYQNRLYYATVGNVKLAIYRKGDLVEISTGHTIDSLAKEKFVTGKITRQEAVGLLENQRLYNFLGADGFKDLEIFDKPVDLIDEDIVTLMTDGIYELLTFKELEESLNKKISTEQMALEIIEKVNQNKTENKDNASIVLLKVGRKLN